MHRRHALLLAVALLFSAVAPATAQLSEVIMLDRTLLGPGDTTSPGVTITAAVRPGAVLTLDATNAVFLDTDLRISLSTEMSLDGGRTFQVLSTSNFVGGPDLIGDGTQPSIGIPNVGQPDATYRVRLTLNKRVRIGLKLGPRIPG